jgi:hypothetical protein
MKITLALAVLSLAGYASATYSDNLKTLYGYVCDEYEQMSMYTAGDSTAPESLYSDNSIFQMITGYNLGTQVERGVTTSTCFGQAR